MYVVRLIDMISISIRRFFFNVSKIERVLSFV